MIGASNLKKLGWISSGPGYLTGYKLKRILNARADVISTSGITLGQIGRVGRGHGSIA